MSALHELYRVNEENLALRRGFVQFGEKDVATLRRLSGWAQRSAGGIATAFYDHQFSHPATRAFFERYAHQHNHSLQDLRTVLERAQAGYFWRSSARRRPRPLRG